MGNGQSIIPGGSNHGDLSEVLYLDEITTPSAVSGRAKLYTKSDNNLYFQDGAGVEHTVEVGAANIRELWLEPAEDPTGTVGNWDIVQINASQAVHFNFQVPGDFEAIASVHLVIIPDATETIQWDVNVSVAADGEAFNNDDRSATDETLAVTINLLASLDISALLTGISPGDHVAVDFQSDTGNLRIVGLDFEYS